MPFTILLIALAGSAFAANPGDFSRCNEPGGPIRADDSPSTEYFKNLLAQGTKAPFEAFVHLWYPGRKSDLDPAAEKKLEYCAKQGNMSPCPLDTAYSWGPKAKLLTLERTMPDGAAWSGSPNPGHTLDTLFSAVASHAYGNIPVRIKVKPGALVITPYGEQWIPNGNQVENWSFGTPEQYDEIVRDIRRSRSGKPWNGYWPVGLAGAKGDPLFPVIANRPMYMDGFTATELELKTSLLEMIRMILNGEGHIYYAAGTCRNRRQAFKTAFPTYIDPFLADPVKTSESDRAKTISRKGNDFESVPAPETPGSAPAQ